MKFGLLLAPALLRKEAIQLGLDAPVPDSPGAGPPPKIKPLPAPPGTQGDRFYYQRHLGKGRPPDPTHRRPGRVAEAPTANYPQPVDISTMAPGQRRRAEATVQPVPTQRQGLLSRANPFNWFGNNQRADALAKQEDARKLQVYRSQETPSDYFSRWYENAPGGFEEARTRAQGAMAANTAKPPVAGYRSMFPEFDYTKLDKPVNTLWVQAPGGRLQASGRQYAQGKPTILIAPDSNPKAEGWTEPGRLHSLTRDNNTLEHELSHDVFAPNEWWRPAGLNSALDQEMKSPHKSQSLFNKRHKPGYDYYSTPTEIDVRLAEIKRNYSVATGRHVDTPEAAQDAMDWFYTEGVKEPLDENFSSSKALRDLLQTAPEDAQKMYKARMLELTRSGQMPQPKYAAAGLLFDGFKIAEGLTRSAVGESGLKARIVPWSRQGEDAWPKADEYYSPGKRRDSIIPPGIGDKEAVYAGEDTGPYSGFAAGNVTGMDKALGGMAYNRKNHPAHYWLNPFVTGPVVEFLTRLQRRAAATRGSGMPGVLMSEGPGVVGGIASAATGLPLQRVGDVVGLGGAAAMGNAARKHQARSAHKAVNMPYNEGAKNEDEEKQAEIGPFDVQQASNTVNMDNVLAGTVRNRKENPWHYWLNPFVPGPMAELAGRGVRRMSAGLMENWPMTLAALPTLGVAPMIAGGEAAKNRARQVYQDKVAPVEQQEVDADRPEAKKPEEVKKEANVGGIIGRGLLLPFLDGPLGTATKTANKSAGLLTDARFGAGRLIGGRDQIPDKALMDNLARLALSLGLDPDELRNMSPLEIGIGTGRIPATTGSETQDAGQAAGLDGPLGTATKTAKLDCLPPPVLEDDHAAEMAANAQEAEMSADELEDAVNDSVKEGGLFVPLAGIDMFKEGGGLGKVTGGLKGLGTLAARGAGKVLPKGMGGKFFTQYADDAAAAAAGASGAARAANTAKGLSRMAGKSMGPSNAAISGAMGKAPGALGAGRQAAKTLGQRAGAVAKGVGRDTAIGAGIGGGIGAVVDIAREGPEGETWGRRLTRPFRSRYDDQGNKTPSDAMSGLLIGGAGGAGFGGARQLLGGAARAAGLGGGRLAGAAAPSLARRAGQAALALPGLAVLGASGQAGGTIAQNAIDATTGMGKVREMQERLGDLRADERTGPLVGAVLDENNMPRSPDELMGNLNAIVSEMGEEWVKSPEGQQRIMEQFDTPAGRVAVANSPLFADIPQFRDAVMDADGNPYPKEVQDANLDKLKQGISQAADVQEMLQGDWGQMFLDENGSMLSPMTIMKNLATKGLDKIIGGVFPHWLKLTGTQKAFIGLAVGAGMVGMAGLAMGSKGTAVAGIGGGLLLGGLGAFGNRLPGAAGEFFGGKPGSPGAVENAAPQAAPLAGTDSAEMSPWGQMTEYERATGVPLGHNGGLMTPLDSGGNPTR